MSQNLLGRLHTKLLSLISVLNLDFLVLFKGCPFVPSSTNTLAENHFCIQNVTLFALEYLSKKVTKF